jgi:dual specificity tyrosine-phosphorylation-regulated kinase 2/3/4
MSLVPRKPNAPATARRPSVGPAASTAAVAPPPGVPSSRPLISRSEGTRPIEPQGPKLEGAPTAGNLTPYEVDESRQWREPLYYTGQNCNTKIQAPVAGSVNFGFDDERGDYTIVTRDHISYRYEILGMLGKGSFGQVVRCVDHKTNTQVAVKIIRNKKRFHTQAQVEIRVLSHLRDRDPEGKYGIIRMLDTFTFRNHVCLTYELLSMNLYEYMKLNKFHPMPLHVVKKIGASLLISLAFMWRESIIHCDLKPENILLRQPNRTGVKVIDLGSACYENERLYAYIQSRFYRAPEVILGLPYTRRIDLWSYACVLCELAVGYPLFPGENEVEQLACIMETLDVPPHKVIQSSPRAAHFFDIHDGVYMPKLVPNSRKKIRQPNTRGLASFLGLDDDDLFVDFVRMFLQWDAADRPAPEPAMRHPWICDAYVGVTPRMPVVPNSARGAAPQTHSSAAPPPVHPSGAQTARGPHPPMHANANTAATAAVGNGTAATNAGAASNVPTLPSIGGARNTTSRR